MIKVIQKRLNYFFYLILILISSSVNFYYGFLGVNPIDNFTIFNAGYYFLNGYIPFKDYWVVTGPFLDFTQLFIFKILGVNWFAYVSHSTLLNVIFSVVTFFTLLKFNLNKIAALFYSLLLSLISYPQVGTPFVDHHASILSLIGLYFFILAVKTSKAQYWFLFPIIFFVSFMSKQTPTAYIITSLFFLIIYFFFYNFNKKNIIALFLGSISSITILIIFLQIFQINFYDFYVQYFSFPSSVGENRLGAGFLFPIEFSRYFLKFKLIHFSYLLLVFVIIKKITKDLDFIKSKDFVIILSLIFTSYAFIFHQLLTLNVKFVYFIIPILAAFSHIYVAQHLDKKKLSLPILILTVIFSSYYFFKYVNERKFVVPFDYYDKKIAVRTNIIDNKYNFNWISSLNSDPKKEIKNIEKIITFFKNNPEKGNYMIITDYQFILSRINNKKNIFINKWYHPGVSYPMPNNKNFNYYKKFIIQKIQDNEVLTIYFIQPSWFRNSNEIFFKKILTNCVFEKTYLNGSIVAFNIKNCF